MFTNSFMKHLHNKYSTNIPPNMFIKNLPPTLATNNRHNPTQQVARTLCNMCNSMQRNTTQLTMTYNKIVYEVQ